MRPILFLIAALLLLLSRPGIAQENGKKDDDRKKAREEWEKLDDKTREERKKALRKLLVGKTEAEKREILGRLKKLDEKSKHEREALRDRHRQMMRDLEARMKKALTPQARNKYAKLAPEFRKDLVSYSWRRIWEASQTSFHDSLTVDEKMALEGLKGRERMKKVGEITDRRILKDMTLEARRAFDARPESERKGELHRLRMQIYKDSMAKVETLTVFPEIEILLGKPKAVIEQTLKASRRPSRWGGRGWGRPRAHHKFDRSGRGFAPDPEIHKLLSRTDPELHKLMHRLPKKYEKEADKEFLRIMDKFPDPQSRQKALDEFKVRLRKLLAD